MFYHLRGNFLTWNLHLMFQDPRPIKLIFPGQRKTISQADASINCVFQHNKIPPFEIKKPSEIFANGTKNLLVQYSPEMT